jgi:predicted Zn-dependent protease
MEGMKIAKKFEERVRLLTPDDRVTRYVSEIGERIAQQNNPWNADFKFSVINDSRMINAFALPGGKIYITTGILHRLDNEAELAVLLGHEVAHVSRRHYARNLGRQMLTSWVKKFFGGTNTGIQEAGLFLTTNLALLSMRQEEELEADYHGALYIFELNYDPAAAVTLTRKLVDMERKMPDHMKFMAITHPPSQMRVEAMIRLNESLPTKEGLTLGTEQYKKNIMTDPKMFSERGWYERKILEPFQQ